MGSRKEDNFVETKVNKGWGWEDGGSMSEDIVWRKEDR
jgi:hypothetical protein